MVGSCVVGGAVRGRMGEEGDEVCCCSLLAAGKI